MTPQPQSLDWREIGRRIILSPQFWFAFAAFARVLLTTWLKIPDDVLKAGDALIAIVIALFTGTAVIAQLQSQQATSRGMLSGNKVAQRKIHQINIFIALTAILILVLLILLFLPR